MKKQTDITLVTTRNSIGEKNISDIATELAELKNSLRYLLRDIVEKLPIEQFERDAIIHLIKSEI